MKVGGEFYNRLDLLLTDLDHLCEPLLSGLRFILLHKSLMFERSRVLVNISVHADCKNVAIHNRSFGYQTPILYIILFDSVSDPLNNH